MSRANHLIPSNAGRTCSEDRYWQAVLAHDRGFDGRFVYAVRSTGIYCRPSCPSRRPRRDQVEFYPQAKAAELAGFRPCRRCGSNSVVAGNRPSNFVAGALGALSAAENQALTLTALGQQLGVSPSRLARGFRRAVGLTPREYAEARRNDRLRSALRRSENVAAAVYDAGYGSSRAVYERAAAQLGMTPGTYRRGGAGMRIGFTIVDSPVGRLLIAATGRGVCRVCLGDSDAALRKALMEEYPAAEIQLDLVGLQPLVNAFRNYLSGETTALELPIDVRATAFQWRVWRELRAIPYGETRTYSQVALAIGEPKAARAVGHACAVNPVALMVPCHRVVREDGHLGSYRWGMARKRALLKAEQRKPAR
jgi:AraC family transcriptional regulator, regulatory protein of adaptative response / methylated-DNA-[protein]-cysteine methyltransferase